LQALFEKYRLINKIICYVKNKGTNLFTMTIFLKQIVNYQRLGILAPFEGVCFGHALSKACQYATFDEKVNSSLQRVNIKFVQSSIQTCKTWPKISRNGRVEWKKMCLATCLQPWKLSTPVKSRFASKVPMF